jgi:pimeloyl-ACP methyl ester carboxylesterase
MNDPTVRHLDLPVRGLTLHARVQGPDDGPPVVLLHGWLDQSGSFDPLAALLAERGFRAIALDLRGHGDSSWAGAGAYYHLVEYLGDLDGVLAALGLFAPGAPPVRLVGHSLGATIALLYAAARPGRLLHATLLDGIPMRVSPAEVPHRMADWLDDLGKPRLRRTVASIEEAAERLRAKGAGLRLEASLHLARGGVSPDPAQGGALAWKWDPWLRGHSPLPVTEQLLGPLYAQITTPLLLLRAGATWLPEERDLRGLLAEVKAPLAVHTIAGTSHHLHLEEPLAVVEKLTQAWSG